MDLRVVFSTVYGEKKTNYYVRTKKLHIFFLYLEKNYEFLIGYHSNFNFECNTERDSIESLSIAESLRKSERISFSQNSNPSPVMHQLHCLLKRSMFDLDLFSITDFVDGHINRDHSYITSSHFLGFLNHPPH